MERKSTYGGIIGYQGNLDYGLHEGKGLAAFRESLFY
jgi:hypothetical protein